MEASHATKRQHSGIFGESAKLPEDGALPTTKGVVASINFEIENSPKALKSEKEKEATENVTKSLVKKYVLLIPKVPLLLKKRLTRKCHVCLKQLKKLSKNR